MPLRRLHHRWSRATSTFSTPDQIQAGRTWGLRCGQARNFCWANKADGKHHALLPMAPLPQASEIWRPSSKRNNPDTSQQGQGTPSLLAGLSTTSACLPPPLTLLTLTESGPHLDGVNWPFLPARVRRERTLTDPVRTVRK